jgi:putative NADH-flavin reductase
MEQSIKIAVIGGTGKAGKYLVNQLLNQGFKIKLVIRNLDYFQLQSPLIEVIQGSVSDYNVVYQLVEDCQVVVSTLGLGQPNSETSIFSQSTKNVLRAMEACNIRRYIVITGLNVDTPFDQKRPKNQVRYRLDENQLSVDYH